MAKHNEIGKLGEDIASKWLSDRGFVTVERNYSKKWGEIDVVARATSGKIHFIEIKTVSYETRHDMDQAISRGTWRPEENVHIYKQKRLARAIQTWIAERKYTGGFQIDILTVRIVQQEKFARIKLIENVIFELE
jgi:putative endonuclease